MTEKEPTPRQQARRQAILDSARALFLSKGFAGTSTDAVAEEAGVSKQTLYVYYPNKEELFAAVLSQQVEKLLTLGHLKYSAPASPDYEWLHDCFVQIAELFLNTTFAPDYLALIRVIIAEAPRFPHLAELFRTAVVGQGLAAISGILQQAARHNLIRLHEPELAARMFIGPLLTYTILDGIFAIDRPITQPDSSRVNQLVEMFLRALS